MATPKKLHRKGGDLAFIEDGHQGNPTLAVRDQSIGAGHPTDPLDATRAKWGVVGEPLTLSQNFRGGASGSEQVTIKVDVNSAVAVTGLTPFIAAGKTYVVDSIEASWNVAEATAASANLKVERLQGTDAVTAGDDLLAATDIDVMGTADTVASGTVLTAAGINVLAAGDRIGIHFALDDANAVATTEFRGGVTIKLTAQADAINPAREGVLFTNKTGRPIELRGAFAAWDVPEATSATLNLNLERLILNDVAGAANGSLLNGLTDVDVTGADDTGGAIVPVTSVSVRAAVLTTGAGLDDATGAGTFVAPAGFTGRTVFTFEVDSTGGTDTVIVRRDGRVLQHKLNMSVSAISLVGGDGVTILWAAATGHALGDVWTVIVSRDTILEDGDRLGFFFDVDAGGTVTVPTELEGLNITTQLVPNELKAASTT